MWVLLTYKRLIHKKDLEQRIKLTLLKPFRKEVSKLQCHLGPSRSFLKMFLNNILANNWQSFIKDYAIIWNIRLRLECRGFLNKVDRGKLFFDFRLCAARKNCKWWHSIHTKIRFFENSLSCLVLLESFVLKFFSKNVTLNLN